MYKYLRDLLLSAFKIFKQPTQTVTVCEKCLELAKKQYATIIQEIFIDDLQEQSKYCEQLLNELNKSQILYIQSNIKPDYLQNQSYEEENWKVEKEIALNYGNYEDRKDMLEKELIIVTKNCKHIKAALIRQEKYKKDLQWKIYSSKKLKSILDGENYKNCGPEHNLKMITVTKSSLYEANEKYKFELELDLISDFEELNRNARKLEDQLFSKIRNQIKEEKIQNRVKKLSLLQETWNLAIGRMCNQENLETEKNIFPNENTVPKEQQGIFKLDSPKQTGDMNKLHPQITELEEENKQLKNEATKLQEQIKNLELSEKKLQMSIKDLDEENKSLQQKIKEMEGNNESHNFSNQNFTINLKNQITNLKKQIEELKLSEEKLQKRIKDIEEENKDLKSPKQNSATTNNQHEKQIEIFKKQIEKLEKSVKELTDANGILENNHQSRIHEMEKQNQNLASELEELKMTRTQLEQKIDNITKEKTELEQQKISVEQQPETENDMLRQQFSENNETLSQLQKNFSKEVQEVKDNSKIEYEKTIIAIQKQIEELVNKFYNFRSDDTSTTNQIYSMILQTQSLNDLYNNGWILSSKDPIIEQDKVYVSVIGSQRSGKTFLIQKLLGTASPETLSSFEGLRVANLSGVNFIDTKSFVSPCPLEKVHSDLQQRFILNEKHKEIIFEFLTQISGIIIYVISNFSLLDQQIINELKAQFTKKLIIVHNYSEIADLAKCKEKFQERLNNYFKVQEKFSPYACEGNNKYFIEEENNHTWHLVLGKENADSGIFFNTSCLKFIKTQYIDSSSGSQKINFKDTLFNLLKERLADQLEGITQDDIKVTENYDKSMEKYQYNFVIRKENNENGMDKNSNNMIKFKSLSSNHVRLIKNNAKALIPPYGLYIDETETDKYLYLIIEGASLAKDGLGVEINKSNHDFEIAVFGEKSIYPTSLSQPKKIDDYRKACEFNFNTKRIPIAEIDPSTNPKEYIKDYLDGNLIVKIPKKSGKKIKANAI